MFATDTVVYLGHICTPVGNKPDPRKIRSIIGYRISFVGLAVYYRCHVPSFAKIAQPLTNDILFIWTEEHQKAFEELNLILSTEPLLIYHDFSQPFIVACDASTKVIGAVLSQLRNGEEKPIAYCSRQLNLAKTK